MTPLFLASSSPILSAKNVDSLLSTKAKPLKLSGLFSGDHKQQNEPFCFLT